MDREISFGQTVAVFCFGALMFFAGYAFHRISSSQPASVPAGTASKKPVLPTHKPSPKRHEPEIINPDSPYDGSGPRGTAEGK